MIETIEIENFQSHKHTILELSPGVNVIKGRSHSGKSAIIRAINWAILNNLPGDYFVSWFSNQDETTSVGISFTDESFVIRKRNKDVNGYDLPNTELAAIRTDLPEEVSKITRMSTINIQDQDEPYFMLTKTPGKVAEEINALVGLEIIDQTITKLNKKENENKAKIKILEKDALEIEDGLSQLSYVEDLEKKVVSVETLWGQYEDLLKKERRLIELAESIKEEDTYIKDTTKWLSIKEPTKKLRELIKQYKEIENTERSLNTLYNDIESNEKIRLQARQQVESLKKRHAEIINSEEYKNLTCQYCGAPSKYWKRHK